MIPNKALRINAQERPSAAGVTHESIDYIASQQQGFLHPEYFDSGKGCYKWAMQELGKEKKRERK